MDNYFVHESSYVDEGVSIGCGTKIWHFCHVQSGAVIGERCSLGQNVDNVFCGPSCVFTNVTTPRAHFPVHGVYAKTRICEGASLGANCTVVCGHTVGKSALIAAGAVVTKDVKPYALMAGVPARQIGWVCECGKRLDASLKCECGRSYIEQDGQLTEQLNN